MTTIPGTPAAGAEQRRVDAEQQHVATEHHAPAPDPVGEPADRRREHHEGERRAGEQQREQRRVEVERAVQREVDERVAGGREPERGGGHEQRTEAPAAQQRHRSAQANRLGDLGGGRPALRLAHQQDDHADAGEREAERDDEQRIEGERRQREQAERDQRADQGAGRVERAVHAERGSEVLAAGGERDHRVARRGAQALAGAVDRHDRRDRAEPAPDDRQRELADGRHAVAEGRDALVPAPAVADVAADQANERGCALEEPVDDAQLQRREAELRQQVQGQHGGHHLRGDVREQAADPEQEDGPADARPATARHERPVGPEQGPGALNPVHALSLAARQ